MSTKSNAKHNPFWSLLFLAAVAASAGFLIPEDGSELSYGVAIGLAFAALFGRLGVDDSDDFRVVNP